MKRPLSFIFLLVFISLFLLPAFSAGQKEGLTIGMMPAINSIPLIIADQLGYFSDEGIEVELVMFKNQMNRETALQTNAIDGTISDLMNAINGRQAGFPLHVTSYTDGDFALMAAPGGRIRSLADWQAAAAGSIRTGLLENSIVYYVTERMLQAAAADPERINFVSTLVLTARIELLLAGQLDAACIPEPLATLTEKQGAVRLADTSGLPSTPGVLLFSDQAIAKKSRQLAAFYRAYNRAVRELNSGYEAYRDIIVQKGEFPPAVRDAFTLPRYQEARVPSEDEYADVRQWMLQKGLLTETPDYAELIDGRFVTGHAAP